MPGEPITTHEVSLNLSTLHPLFLTRAKTIHDKMMRNPDVPTPNPPLRILASLIVVLEAAEIAARGGGKGLAGLRNLVRRGLASALRLEKATVQGAVDLDPARAIAIAEGCGMGIKMVPVRLKADMAATQRTNDPSGVVHLARKRAGFHSSSEWRYSIDGGTTFVSATSTTACSTDVNDVPVGVLVAFQHRFLMPKGYADWSQIVTLVVR